MPDVHLGKGATVGSVIAMESAISPAAVGVDIGCDVSGVHTSLFAHDLPDDLPDDLRPLRNEIESRIPVGFHSHDENVDVKALGLDRGWHPFWSKFRDLDDRVQNLATRAQTQMGTLGGGKSFHRTVPGCR